MERREADAPEEPELLKDRIDLSINTNKLSFISLVKTKN
jgi:hypothetical protein